MRKEQILKLWDAHKKQRDEMDTMFRRHLVELLDAQERAGI